MIPRGLQTRAMPVGVPTIRVQCYVVDSVGVSNLLGLRT